ncbi:MAG: zinc-binding alcohol dehydrogenase family protein [Pseudomonadota bacterium]
MKAIAVINDTLQDIELPLPQALARDLLVKIAAISVNPVDHKMRGAATEDGSPRVLGWDVAGVVSAVGPDVTLFKVGDEVYYAGSLVRPGANSEYHVVDERIVGRKPSTLDFVQAAALPLTSITAWEAIYERLGVKHGGGDEGKRILIVGAAGGVGSIAIQLAKKLARLTVVATASRPESAEWCRKLGADHMIDHNGDLPAQLKALGIADVDFILCLNEFDHHFPAMVEALAPQGKLCSIVKNERPLALDLLFSKSATLVFELMFTRAMFQTADMDEQHKLLTILAGLIDEGRITTTVGEVFGAINAANIAKAHAALEARRTIGKIVLSGFQ